MYCSVCGGRGGELSLLLDATSVALCASLYARGCEGRALHAGGCGGRALFGRGVGRAGRA